jgi:methionyl-tRNA synthetase
MSRTYFTTPIYYVNDHPHIGHIYTTLVTDTLARYRRLRGDEVYFLTGTDEHGQKIERAAEERGIPPRDLADEVVARYHQLWEQLDITHDDFIRTTDTERHYPGVREIIRRIEASGDFYLDHHEGLYCAGCETYYTEKELEGDKCPVHGSPVERRSEENLFFRLSKYQEPLLELYDRHPEFVRPETRLNEVRQFVDSGLRDLSVSRTNLGWGIPFPGHDGHTVYVWLDALTNYISALGFGTGGEGDEGSLYERFWAGGGRQVHLVGKDILRFHAVYWPAFLLSAGLPLPTTVWAHGWWLQDDQKISKSVGNIVRPDHLVERFGVDALRHVLLRDMVFGQDASFSDEAFIDRYNSDLANDLGNTVSRLVTLSRRAFDGHLPPRPGEGLRAAAETAVEEYLRWMDEFAFHRALEALFKLISETSQFLSEHQPWKAMKDPAALDTVSEVLWSGLEAARIVAQALVPILPRKAPEVLTALVSGPGDDFEAALAWGGLATGAELPAVDPIFPRIDKKAYLAEVTAPGVSPEKKKEKTVTEEPKKAAAPEDERISIDQFMAVELRVGTVVAAEAVPKSKKLLQLSIDLGEDDGPRTVLAGISKAYEPESLVERQVVVVANLKPAKLMGIESNGMVLAASEDGKPVLLHPENKVPNGTRVR